MSARITLDPTQQRVVDHDGGLLVYLGAPGAGTTTALAHAIAHRSRTWGASSVWSVSVGRRAAADLRSDVARLLGSGALPTITTIHALAFGILRAWGQPAPGDSSGPAGVRVLSGAEEDVRIRELISGTLADGTVAWPDSLAEALPTLAFANEVRAFVARLREKGVDPRAVVDRHRRDPVLSALIDFAVIEQATADLENVVDYSGLIDLAVDVVSRDDVRADVHRRVRALYVDDAQDLDPLQMTLVECLAGPQATLVVAGDPARSVFGFRGSDPRGLARLVNRPGASPMGRPAKVVIADRVHRGSAAALACAARVLGGQSSTGLPADTLVAMRQVVDGEGSQRTAGIEVISCDGALDLYAHIARALSQVHIDQGVPWSDLAVVTRSAGTVAAVRRSLESAGVPVTTLASDLALPEESSVAVLLRALEAAIDPVRLSVRGVEDLMSSPIMAADPDATRVLARSWRALLREQSPDRVPPRFGELQRDALVAVATQAEADIPEAIADLPAMARIRAAGLLLARVGARVRQGVSPVHVLWDLWSGALPDARGVAWPDRLRRAALGGHRASGHEIDAVLALFATAERMTQRFRGVVGAAAFVAAIDAQQVPAEAIAERGLVDADAVSVLTAHHARGRSWHTVVVVDVQEGIWPASTVRRGVIDVDAMVDRLDPARTPDVTIRDALADAARGVEADRRLLYTALTRAHHRTIVGTVASAAEAGWQPSRFVDDLGNGDPRIEVDRRPGRPVRPLTLSGHVARLRTRLLEPGLDEVTQAAIADELAALALMTDDNGRALIPAADPRTWWHVSEPTRNDTPLRPVDWPIRLSASALRAITTCPLQWFLDRQIHAGPASGATAAVGNVVHALAEAVVDGRLPSDPDILDGELDRVWSHLGFDIPWQDAAQRRRVRDMVERLCRFHRRRAESAFRIDAEVHLDGEIDLVELVDIISAGQDDPGAQAMRDVVGTLSDVDTTIGVSGRIDRLEITADGVGSIFDLKTSAHPPGPGEVAQDLQLALYQAAALSGAIDIDPVDGSRLRIGESGLVALGVEPARDPGQPKVITQPALPAHPQPQWLFAAIADAITVVRTGDCSPRPGEHCRTCAFTTVCPTNSRAEGLS